MNKPLLWYVFVPRCTTQTGSISKRFSPPRGVRQRHKSQSGKGKQKNRTRDSGSCPLHSITWENDKLTELDYWDVYQVSRGSKVQSRLADLETDRGTRQKHKVLKVWNVGKVLLTMTKIFSIVFLPVVCGVVWSRPSFLTMLDKLLFGEEMKKKIVQKTHCVQNTMS